MLIYDIEIVNAIKNKDEDYLPDIKYCKGWGDHANMGISCIGVYDYEADSYRVFMADNMRGFYDLLATHKCCVGFNSIGFDNKVILACEPDENVRRGLSNYFDVASYDILAEIWRALGLDPGRFYWGTHGGYGLDAMCEANFGTKKSGNGALAPVWFQRGEYGKLIDYCLNDVKLTKQLLDRIINAISDDIRLATQLVVPQLKDPKTGKMLTLRLPNA
jgi:hypothetical protein